MNLIDKPIESMNPTLLTVLILEKSGECYEKKVKGIDRLYSVCNYRNEEGFEELHTWIQSPGTATITMSTPIFVLYGKRKGKNNYENKCILPQPMHQELFYGNLCVVKKVGQTPVSLTQEEWSRILENEKEDLKPELKELKKEDYEPEPTIFE